MSSSPFVKFLMDDVAREALGVGSSDLSLWGFFRCFSSWLCGIGDLSCYMLDLCYDLYLIVV